MNIDELIEIALANSDHRRVEVAALEPADVDPSAIGGLAPLIAELVDNALGFSGPDDVVRVTGLNDQGTYLISISDSGVGIPDDLLAELNRLLVDPEPANVPNLGVAMIARLADRHGFDVNLAPGARGATARVTVPGRFVSAISAESQPSTRSPDRETSEEVFAHPEDFEETVDLTRFEQVPTGGSGMVAMTVEEKHKTEALLDKVFAPLLKTPGMTERPSRSATGGGNEISHSRDPGNTGSVSHPRRHGKVGSLRVRVPGENVSVVEDDQSTVDAEWVIDIRLALSRGEHGGPSVEKSVHSR